MRMRVVWFQTSNSRCWNKPYADVFILFQILHFFNTPPQVTEAELIQVFKDYDVVPPKAVKLFPMKSERSSSGLLEFENTTEAVAAVMACNHAAIESPGRKIIFFY